MIQERVHAREIDTTSNLAAAPVLTDQAGPREGVEMMGEGRGWNAEVPLDVADPEAGLARPHEQAEDPQPMLVSQGRQGRHRLVFVHPLPLGRSHSTSILVIWF